MNMDMAIETAFSAMRERYRELLENVYPARGSTGFTEANQVHVFVHSLVSALGEEDVFSWLEFPWERKTEHVDALVFSQREKAVFYIEAKRLSVPAKRDGIFRDIRRVCETDRRFLAENGIADCSAEYLIVLADVWLESKWKRAVPCWWTGESNPIGFGERSLRPKDTFVDCAKQHGIDWQDGRQLVHPIGATAFTQSTSKYCLLLAYKRI